MIRAAAQSVAAVLEEGTRQLRAAGIPEPRRDAAALMALALRTDRGGVAARKPDPLSPAAASRFASLIASRARRAPLQHLSGVAEFRGLDFEVGPSVLIPRPETEDLVQAVLDAGLPADARVADLGTGSGCIAVAMAVERPSWRVLAIDVSAEALQIAARNASKHGVADRVAFALGRFGEAPDHGRGVFDAVVSNPPYVPECEWIGLQPEVRDHEPRIALVPGPSGHEAYETVARAAGAMLRPGGRLALELGWTSEAAVRRIVAAAAFSDIAVRPDLRGIPRVLTARR